jgi:FkbH-like protein
MSASLAVSATFTAESVADTLSFWMNELGLELPVRFAPYNQVFQQLLDPASVLATNRGGVNAILVRWEDWPAGGAEEFAESIRRAASFPSPTVVIECPASPKFSGSAEEMRKTVANAVATLAAVYFVSAVELDSCYPVQDFYDPHAEELGHIPYTPEFFAALGTMIARKAHALKRTPSKVIALDCDETLWIGICGEDGPNGVIVDPTRRGLQEFMRAQRQAGVLLCLCSKNNEEDVAETFRANPSMPLRLEDFVANRINWEPKAENLRSLAEELDLALDSFIFVDDNPAECAQVQTQAPEVICLTLPPDSSEIPHFLRHVWAFDRLKTTSEDEKRSEMYAQRVERAKFEKQAGSLEDFLAALNLEIEIAPMTPQQLPRVSQLTLRTNQMNFTAVRRTESEMMDAIASGGFECLTVRVRDRFGDYGLVGVMVFRTSGEAITVDTFLLSCRALGKGVEHRMLARLGEIARERGLARVSVPFAEAPRNKPARNFLESVGAEYRVRVEGGRVYPFPAAYLAELKYKPVAAEITAASQRSGAAKTAAPYARIANELSTAKQVLDAVRARRQLAVGVTTGGIAPRTPLEQQLAAIWADLLGLQTVGVEDNFFDLGGHSLLAVQLLSAVRQAFDVDLSLEIVYSGAFTVAELAKAIELYEIQEAGEGEYAELLKELEGLSDEEVRALLAEEEGGETAR